MAQGLPAEASVGSTSNLPQGLERSGWSLLGSCAGVLSCPHLRSDDGVGVLTISVLCPFPPMPGHGSGWTLGGSPTPTHRLVAGALHPSQIEGTSRGCSELLCTSLPACACSSGMLPPGYLPLIAPSSHTHILSSLLLPHQVQASTRD